MEGTVVDACSFNDDAPKIGIAEGCSTMYVTQDVSAAISVSASLEIQKSQLS